MKSSCSRSSKKNRARKKKGKEKRKRKETIEGYRARSQRSSSRVNPASIVEPEKVAGGGDGDVLKVKLICGRGDAEGDTTYTLAIKPPSYFHK